jgi:hypothetical protein
MGSYRIGENSSLSAYREAMKYVDSEGDVFDARGKTLEDAKRWLRARFSKGATCPCCHQFTKLYKRNFNKSMAYVLLLISCYFRGDPVEEWLHVPSYIAEMVSDHPRRAAAVRGDWAKLKLWGLIEEKPGEREDGSPRVGYWKLTPLGKQFVNRQVKVPSHVYIYNGAPLPKVVDTLITIDDALGTEFSYEEIMGAA